MKPDTSLGAAFTATALSVSFGGSIGVKPYGRLTVPELKREIFQYPSADRSV